MRGFSRDLALAMRGGMGVASIKGRVFLLLINMASGVLAAKT